VKGIGPKTVEKLLRQFGSLERVKAANEAELAKIVGASAARRVKGHLGASLAVIPLVQIEASLAVEEPQPEHVGETG
jgi:ERCC4-type nuclease